MMTNPVLTATELDAALAELNQWSVLDGKLHRDLTFPGFPHAFAFMAGAATCIERLNHHPEWTNVYNRVSINLVTHDSGGITRLDVKLARILESLAVTLL